MLDIPVIPATKNYWLVRTQGGRYYSDFRRGGFIAINWDKISIEEINELSEKELIERVKKDYPDKRKPGRTANQLRIFNKFIKKGDLVIITDYASSRISIGEVLEDEPYAEYIKKELIEENRKICPFQKRKRVNWIKQLHKWELDLNLFKLMQHAQHTISSANEYGDLIESLIHDFFIKGDEAQLVLQVKKEGKIPMSAFFPMGTEILKLAEEFSRFSKNFSFNTQDIETQVHVSSPGKIKLAGPALMITAIGLILVGLTGGHYKINFPIVGGGLDVNMNSLVREVSDFLDQQQIRKQQEMILRTYMENLDVRTPEELTSLLKAIETQNGSDNQQKDAEEKNEASDKTE